MGETKLQKKPCIDQHFKTLQTGKWNSSGLSNHARNCHKNIDWYKNNTLSISKVREILEIRYNNTHHEGMNLDEGNWDHRAGMLLHAKTRTKLLIDKFYELGLSIP